MVCVAVAVKYWRGENKLFCWSTTYASWSSLTEPDIFFSGSRYAKPLKRTQQQNADLIHYSGVRYTSLSQGHGSLQSSHPGTGMFRIDRCVNHWTPIRWNLERFPPKFDVDNIYNETLGQDLPQQWNEPDGLVPMCMQYNACHYDGRPGHTKCGTCHAQSPPQK